MSETLSQIIAKMGTPAKPTGSTPKVPKEPKVPKVVQKARQTAVKRSPNPFVQAVEQAFKPTTPTKPQEPNLGQIIKQFKDVASSGRKQRGETLMQEYIRNTQPVSGNMGFKAGSGKGATIEAEMAAYDRKTFGAETYGKRPKGVSTAEWSKRQSHKGKFKQLAGTRNEQVAELDREIEAYKLENMTPVQRLELARETSGGLPGFYDKERASALAASLMGSQDLKDKTDASLFIRAANQVMQPVSTAYTVAMKDPRSLAEMPVGLQVGLSAGDLGAQIVGGFLTGGASTPATASTLARIGAVATRALALDAPGYIQMIEDAGGVDKALVAYKDMIGKALDPNSKISASERVNGIALAGMLALSGGGKIAGKGPHADPNITTRLIETEALPGSVPDLRGQVGGVGLDAEPALRPGGKEPVAGVEPEKDSRLKDLVEGFDEPEVEPLSDREKVRAAGGAVRKEDFPHLTDQQIIVANRGMPGARAKAEVKAARERIAAKGIQDLDPERIKAFNDEAEAVAAGRDEAWIDDHMIGKYETEIAELEAKGSPRSAGKLADLRSKLGEIKQRQAERVEMEALKGQSGATADSVEPAGTSSRDGEPEMPATGLARQFTDQERFARELEETKTPAQSVQKLVEMEALKGQSGATADSVEPAGTSSRDGEPEMPATGLARQFTDPERFARELEETRAPAQSVQKLVDATQAEWGDGGHIKAELALRRGNEPGFNPTRDQIVKDTAMVAHLKREVKNEYDRLLRKDDPTPQDMADIQAVEAKLNEIDEYAQKIRTHWHDVGMALQIAYKPDFTVADLTMRARAANGGDISPDAQKQINDWVSKYEAAQKELDELRKAKPPKEVSGVAVSKPRAARATAFNRLANLGLEVRGEDGALVAPTKGGGMKGGKQAGAVTIPKLTPSMENELRKSIRQIAKAYIVDEHPIAGSLDGVVTLVRKHLPSLSEEDILRYLSDRYHRVLLDSDLQRRESQAFMRRIQAAADYRNKTLLEKGFAQAGALLNTTQRGLQASMDLSAPFRQGRRVMVTKEWVNAWLPSTKAMFAKDPQKAMELHSAELARSPYYSKGVESGLGISSASKPEEVWAGRLLQDWAAGKGLAAGKANPLRAYANLIQRSEAHYTIFLNDLRMRLFENLAKRNPNDKEYLESIAQMINVMTGRGHGKTATMLSHPAAGNVFYAPRYAWSEVQSTGMVPIWKTKSKMARQEAIKAYGRNFAVTVVGLSLARLFGNEVELDPRGTDFLKVRLQNGKVVDVLGASQQYLRLLVRMGYGSVSRKGFYSEPGAFGADPLMQAVNNKLSPAARFLLGLLRGWASPNADGDWEKQPAGMILRDAVTPMGARKTGDQMWSDGDKWALLNLLGIDYEKGQPKTPQKKGSRPPKLEGLPQGTRQFAGHAPITGR